MGECERACCQATGLVRAVIEQSVLQAEEYQHILVGGLEVRWSERKIHLSVVTSCPPATYDREACATE